MSFQAMTWAVEQDLPALQKLVLLMLANCCNSRTGRCDPSHDTLAKECGMSRDSVRRAIAEIEKKGLIEIRRQTQNGVNLPNQYVLKVGSSVGVVGADSTEGYVHTEPTVGADSTGGRCSQQGGVGADSTTNQEVKPGSKPKALSSRLDGADSYQRQPGRQGEIDIDGNPVAEVIGYLNERADTKFQVVEASAKLIRARIREGATVAQMRAVIDAKAREWPKGHQMRQYLRPATLFNAEKFEQYRGQLELDNGNGRDADTRGTRRLAF
ncbi:conserved phage C-terminal domain-containing protein [Burkholderia ubonensis]|uniref:conserved phage C-terminal domain-containing protein n=1 Tax=Burkholderia ubonensis TaxID=101571 RepID=UPI0007592F47|nr:conserved phage C-terminal domain-containing protein [Burkholderia ubonensis]KWB54201.1 hypothetical protein WL36_02155 [Burkholderia ubonensis]